VRSAAVGRRIIRDAVNGDDDTCVIFTGSGSTAAIDKLVGVLGIRIPADLDRRYSLSSEKVRALGWEPGVRFEDGLADTIRPRASYVKPLAPLAVMLPFGSVAIAVAWLPVICVAATLSLGTGLRSLAIAKGRGLWRGLAIMQTLEGRSRLLGLVLIAVFAQIARNWLMLHAVGLHASVFDATAVLIAVAVLGALPVGPGVGAGAMVLILGSTGVAGVTAAGVLLTATGTVGALAYGGWALADRFWTTRKARLRVPAPGTAGRAPALS